MASQPDAGTVGGQPVDGRLPAPGRWRHKSETVEALQWDGSVASATTVIDWILANGGTARYHDDEPARPHIDIDIPGGIVHASPGDWIARREDGVFWPWFEDSFASQWEPADGPGSRWALFWASPDPNSPAAMLVQVATQDDAQKLLEWIEGSCVATWSEAEGKWVADRDEGL